jgi:hypothetical protein
MADGCPLNLAANSLPRTRKQAFGPVKRLEAWLASQNPCVTSTPTWHTPGQRSNRTPCNYAEALPHIVEADEYRRIPSLKFGYHNRTG